MIVFVKKIIDDNEFQELYDSLDIKEKHALISCLNTQIYKAEIRNKNSKLIEFSHNQRPKRFGDDSEWQTLEIVE